MEGRACGPGWRGSRVGRMEDGPGRRKTQAGATVNQQDFTFRDRETSISEE